MMTGFSVQMEDTDVLSGLEGMTTSVARRGISVADLEWRLTCLSVRLMSGELTLKAERNLILFTSAKPFVHVRLLHLANRRVLHEIHLRSWLEGDLESILGRGHKSRAVSVFDLRVSDAYKALKATFVKR